MRNTTLKKAHNLSFLIWVLTSPTSGNPYTEIKRKLVEDYGIPAHEIRFIQEAKNEKMRKLYFTYDKYNNITRRKIEDIRPSPKTTVQTLRYEYDTHHNYIQETCLSGGEVLYTQKRVISYYD